MSEPDWIVRPAREGDRERLKELRCASAANSWEFEVEKFIQGYALDWALEPQAREDDPRLLLVFARASEELVGVTAHERTVLLDPDGEPIKATKLEVVAVALNWQKKRFGSGERVSDVVMSAAMKDISTRVPAHDSRVFAVVHEQNERSVNPLCQRE